MQQIILSTRSLLTAAFVTGFLFLSAVAVTAQVPDSGKLPKRITIQASALGQSTQLGRLTNIKVILEELSTREEQLGLLEAFKSGGNEGLVNALEKMHAKGRIAIDGTLGYDIAYARKFKQDDGTVKLRIITNRAIRQGEVWGDTRTLDYNLTALELVFKLNKKGKVTGEGTLLPAAQFKIDKENQLEIKLYQNPWTLNNLLIYGLK